MQQQQPNEIPTVTRLNVGPEIDERIASSVMQWQYLGERWSKKNHSGYEWRDREWPNARYTLKQFSTVLEEAMLIVERKRRDGWVFSLQALPPDPANADNMLWECVFQRSEVDGGFQEGHGATAPEAIARAALAEIER